MSQCTVVYPLKFSYQCIVKQNSYFVTNLVSLVATIASILIFFGCLSFVVVVVVFHSSKICIQLLPFLCDFVFVAHNESHVHFVNYTTILLLL